MNFHHQIIKSSNYQITMVNHLPNSNPSKGKGTTSWLWVFSLTLFIFGLLSMNSHGATKTATTSGNWSVSTIWSAAGVPASTDDVVINSGVTVSVTAAATCTN